MFGNIFERRESKCCAVLLKHYRKVKREQGMTCQMAQQLKTKRINVVTRQPLDRLTVLMIKINFSLL